MRTSYDDNLYDLFFDWLVYSHRPRLIVEAGVLDGYSLLAFAEPAKVIGAKVYGIDLFEDYQFKNSSMSQVQEILNKKYLDNVTLIRKDAMSASEIFVDDSIDILHIDISNDGEKLENMFNFWDIKVKKGGLIVFEGGSFERDNVDWMKKYNKAPITEFKRSLPDRNYEYVTFLPFPSVTVCRKG